MPALTDNGSKKSGPSLLLSSVLLVVISTFITVAVAESILRQYYVLPEPLAMSYPLGHGTTGANFRLRQKEFNVGYRINKNGFRDEEIPFSSGHGGPKILFLGDSIVEGFGVEERDRFSNMLVDGLNQKVRAAPVAGINVGQLGTNPISYLDNFVRFGVALKPDVAIMTIFVGNDFDGGGALAPVVSIPAATANIETYKYTDCSNIRWANNSYVFAIVRQLFCKNDIIYPRFRGGNIWELMLGRPLDEKLIAQLAAVPEAEIKQKLSELPKQAVIDTLSGQVNPGFLVQSLKAREKGATPAGARYTEKDIDVTLGFISAAYGMARENKIKMAVVVVPSVFEVHQDAANKVLEEYWGFRQRPPGVDQLAVLRKRLAEYLDANNYDYYDSTDDLKAAGELAYYLYDQHLNQVGHRVVATGLSRLLQSRGYLNL